MACPAKPTCGLAMTHAEQALPRYLAELEREGLGSVDVMIRMAGCPNGCSRPPTAEIGIVGYGKNDYVFMVGGARNGSPAAAHLRPVPSAMARTTMCLWWAARAMEAASRACYTRGSAKNSCFRRSPVSC